MTTDNISGFIDLHHHSLFPAYIAAMNKVGVGAGGGYPFPHWDANEDLAMMDRQGIATAILSIASPGVYIEDINMAKRLARLCNEELADLMRSHPRRFGALAILPLPDVDAALSELTYALDELKLDGISLLTNVGGQYLGDPLFDPLMAEVSRRQSTVFVHPHEPPVSEKVKLHLPASYVEFLSDTTRAVANLLISGTLELYPHVSFILSHGGAAVPAQAWRLAMGLEAKHLSLHHKAEHAIEKVSHRPDRDILDEGKRGLELLRTRFFYDTALATTPFAMAALRELVGPDRIVFGSDIPYAPEFIVAESVAGLSKYGKFDEASLRGVTRGNALRMFPTLAKRLK